jgi:hypothetical protein
MAHAASDLPVYEDGLRRSRENGSWAAVELASTAVVHSGTTSVAVTAAPWSGTRTTAATMTMMIIGHGHDHG